MDMQCLCLCWFVCLELCGLYIVEYTVTIPVALKSFTSPHDDIYRTCKHDRVQANTCFLHVVYVLEDE